MTHLTVIDWIVIAGALFVPGVSVTSWLMSYQGPHNQIVESNISFLGLPTWAQIVPGLATLILLTALGYWLWIPLPLAISPKVPAILSIGGLAVFVVGCSLAWRARWTLDAMYGISTCNATQLRAEHRLIQHGPYALVRHPMYLGYWLVLLGVTLIYLTWTPLLFLALSIVLFYGCTQPEESALAEWFGEEWRAFAARTKFVIPFVY